MGSLPEQLKSHFRNLYHLAFVDSNLTPQELDVIYRVGLERGVSKDEVNSIVLGPKINVVAPSSCLERADYLYDYARLIVSDKAVNSSERQCLCELCSAFGIKTSTGCESIVDVLLDAAQRKRSISEVCVLLDELFKNDKDS